MLPASTAVPMHESTPERKELKGNDPTNPMYATCFSHTKQHDGKSLKAFVNYHATHYPTRLRKRLKRRVVNLMTRLSW